MKSLIEIGGKTPQAVTAFLKRATIPKQNLILLGLISGVGLFSNCQQAWSQEEDDSLSKPRGLYLGVKPGETTFAPGKKLLPTEGMQRIIWVGFQNRRDRAQIFIQTDSAPIFEIADSGPLKVVVDFPNAQLHTKNDGRALDVSFFPTVVRSLQARQVSKSLVRLVIHLRQPARYVKKKDSRFLHLIFDPPKEPVDVVAEHEMEMEEQAKTREPIEYRQSTQ